MTTAQISATPVQSAPQPQTTPDAGTANSAPGKTNSFQSRVQSALHHKAEGPHNGRAVRTGKKPDSDNTTDDLAPQTENSPVSVATGLSSALQALLSGEAPVNTLLTGITGTPATEATPQGATSSDAPIGDVLSSTASAQSILPNTAQPALAAQPDGTAFQQTLPVSSAVPMNQQQPVVQTDAEAATAVTVPTAKQTIPEVSAAQAAATGTSAQQTASASASGKTNQADALPTAPQPQADETSSATTQSEGKAATTTSSPSTVKGTGEAEVQASTASVSQSQKDQPGKETDSASQNSHPINPFAQGPVVIKVSDASAKQAVSAPHQVASAITQQIQQGKQEFQVDLYPQSLGKVSVKMVAENGVLTIELAASNPKTQSLLLSSSGEIRSMLQSATGQPVTVTSPQQPQQSWYAQPQDGGNSGAQQQQQQQQNNRHPIQFGDLDTGIPTDDFLTLLRVTGTAG